VTQKISTSRLPIGKLGGADASQGLAARRVQQMFGTRERNEAQIASCSRGGELDKGRFVKNRRSHSAVDRQRIDRV
jgi:hypothetical protein